MSREDGISPEFEYLQYMREHPELAEPVPMRTQGIADPPVCGLHGAQWVDGCHNCDVARPAPVCQECSGDGLRRVVIRDKTEVVQDECRYCLGSGRENNLPLCPNCGWPIGKGHHCIYIPEPEVPTVFSCTNNDFETTDQRAMAEHVRDCQRPKSVPEPPQELEKLLEMVRMGGYYDAIPDARNKTDWLDKDVAQERIEALISHRVDVARKQGFDEGRRSEICLILDNRLAIQDDLDAYVAKRKQQTALENPDVAA